MISVCCAYWDRQAALDGMFQDYVARYGGLDFEFSICDDGSPIPAKVPPRIGPWPVVLTRLPTKTRPLNPCVPLNRAVVASSGAVIALTNPEVEHPAPVLPGMLALLDDRTVVLAQCWDIERQMWLAGPTVDYTTWGRLPVPPGAHFHFLALLTRALWDHAGGFDEDYRFGQACDDNDWLWRLYDAGARFALAPGIVHHRHLALHWRLPFNGGLFDQKWPPHRREALIAARQTSGSARSGGTP